MAWCLSCQGEEKGGKHITVYCLLSCNAVECTVSILFFYHRMVWIGTEFIVRIYNFLTI